MRTTWCSRVVPVAVIAVGVLVGSVSVAQAAQPKPTVTSGAATITAVTLAPGSSNHAFVTRKSDVDVAGQFKIGDTGGAIDQIQIGWAGSDHPLGCVYDGPGSNRASFDFHLGAPPAAGSNLVIVNFAQDFGCSTDSWWSSNAGPAIAEAAVTPPKTVTTGPATYTAIGIDLTNDNAVTRPQGTAATLKGKFKIAPTGGISAALLVGWAGSSEPVGCVYSGPGGQPATKINFPLGLPPQSTGANYVVAAFYPSCDRSQWPTLTKSSLAVVYAVRTAG